MNQTLFDNPFTQTEELLAWFKNGKTVTSMEAYEYFGITQLGARLTELELKGHSFERPRVRLDSGKVVCRYRLKGK